MKYAAILLVAFGIGCDTGADAPEVTTAALNKAKKDHKVLVCHHAGPHGKVVTISIDASAVDAHLEHWDGDFVAGDDGSCEEAPVCDNNGVPCPGVEGDCCPQNWSCQADPATGDNFCTD